MNIYSTKSVLKAIVMSMAFLLTSNISCAKETASEKHNQQTNVTYFSLGDEHGFPTHQEKNVFDCTDKIYSVVKLTKYPTGKHQLSIRWIDPSETTREHTKYAFHIRQDKTRLWAWLSLSRARGSGMMQWLNPAAGLEEFIGLWNIEIRIDNKLISKDQFEVSC